MTQRQGSEAGMQTSPNPPQDCIADSNMERGDGGEEVSLEEILNLYGQPINEEQAWAVCYQCCRTLVHEHRRRGSRSPGKCPRRIEGPGDVKILKDGTVSLQFEDGPVEYQTATTSLEVIDSIGVMIYKALDYGLKESEERELTPPLEHLIDMMTNPEEKESDNCPDEGYEATEEEDECEEEDIVSTNSSGTVGSVQGYNDIIKLCSSHLPTPSEAPNHYQAVCRALYAESRELSTFLEKIKSAKENLRKMEGEAQQETVKDLDELQNADWARFWVQVMRDLRHGVKLKKVQERQYNPLAIEYQLTPYEMLMDDIRSKRYKLRKVMVNGDIPPRLKKSAHEIILEFIRSRPPLNPAAARKLKPHPPRPLSLHERLLDDIRAERKLRPVSPDMIRRNRLGAGKSISTPQDLCRSSDTPDGQRKLAVSTQSLASGAATTAAAAAAVAAVASQGGGQPLLQRKRLLKAPTLAELDSSGSEEEATKSSCSMSPSLMEDRSLESIVEKKVAPKFLPISATPQHERHRSSQRRHSLEKEAPTSVRSFLPPSKHVSKSLEEFCYPVECLTLTVEEVMHIRQVLVKAELEKFQQYKDVYTALKKGKLCFSCRTKRFSLFTWSYTCQFCKRPVCSQCSKKIRLPSKPYSTLPIYSLGPSTTSKVEAATAVAPADADKIPFGSAQTRQSLRRRLSKHSSSKDGRSLDELEFPKELTEDWATMEVCVDCKKFITEIITSNKRSLSVASKRARINRKTQSFYMSSSRSVNFRPTPRTIKEV